MYLLLLSTLLCKALYHRGGIKGAEPIMFARLLNSSTTLLHWLNEKDNLPLTEHYQLLF